MHKCFSHTASVSAVQYKVFLRYSTRVSPVQHKCLSRTAQVFLPYSTNFCPVQHKCLSHTAQLFLPYSTNFCPVQHKCLSHTAQVFLPYSTSVCPVQHKCFSRTVQVFFLTAQTVPDKNVLISRQHNDTCIYYLGLVTKKTCLWVSNKARLKSVPSATETSYTV